MKRISVFLIAGALATIPVAATTERAHALYDTGILQHFDCDQFPEHLRETCFPFRELAHWMHNNLPLNTQNHEGLLRLLEARDYAIRARTQISNPPPIDEDDEPPIDEDDGGLGNDGRGFLNR